MFKYSGKRNYQELTNKKCQFPECNEDFLGRGKTKYCPEHQKQKYKKVLYGKSHKTDGIGSNVLIKHKYKETHMVEKECALDGCHEKFEIVLIPNQYIYPQYCSEHRNKYKREFFIKLNTKEDL